MDNVGLVIMGYGVTALTIVTYVGLLRRRTGRARERAAAARRGG